MKKYIVSSVVALTLIAPAISFGAVVPPPQGNGDPMKVEQAWGLDGYHTPSVTCNLFGLLGNKCVDISSTSYYLARLNPVGVTYLKVANQFGQFAFN